VLEIITLSPKHENHKRLLRRRGAAAAAESG
jgi:hypothetical protein